MAACLFWGLGGLRQQYAVLMAVSMTMFILTVDMGVRNAAVRFPVGDHAGVQAQAAAVIEMGG